MLFLAKNSELLIPEEDLTASGKKCPADVTFKNLIKPLIELICKVAITHVLSLLDQFEEHWVMRGIVI